MTAEARRPAPHYGVCSTDARTDGQEGFMAAEGKQPNEANFFGRPERTDIPTTDELSRRADGLGLDDLTDSELAAIDIGTLSGEGGLGFDDLTDVERIRLAEHGTVEGGLGLDDSVVVGEDEDEYRAA
jgi:hypothetical protein